ncbi:MAG: precorrin-8X methylmutase [Eubacterium sp.]|jgi:precorrin-8X/cobalt-precorrin-8 methylmutase|nr:precorrin-8X methylmutase [Eubacterium sp.]
MTPSEIEKKSMEIIEQELYLRGKKIPEEQAPIIKRAIHATADFEYAETLYFSQGVIEHAKESIKNGACVITDTKMAKSGINKFVLEKFGGNLYCFMSDKEVAANSIKNNTTRAAESIDKALEIKKPCIFVIGNAPTALIRLYEHIKGGLIKPELIIAVPVGFVNVVEAKDHILSLDSVPHIVNCGRKGGSNVAAAVFNSLLYLL